MITMPVRDPEHQALCDAIKARRDVIGVTQQVVADRIGISKSQYADIEQGRNEPKWTTLTRVAAALETTVSELTENIDTPALT